VLRAIGRNPRIATKPAMQIGRKRRRAPSSIALLRGIPFARFSLIVETMIRPFSTETPEATTKPTPDDIVKGISRIQMATSPPKQAKAVPVKMINESRTDPVLVYRRIKIKKSARGITIMRRV
jgi:hypothetical protein